MSACGGEEPIDEEEQSYALTEAVERWRKPVEKYFRKQHVTWALNIIRCESGGNPNAYNASSGASGLFQHLSRYWASRAAAAGFGGKSPFNGEANIAASAVLLYAPGGGPGHWVCKYSPFANSNYEPKYYNNGVPVKRCTPHCDGDVMIDDQCGKGDCSKYGSRCVKDSLGLRCVFAACPARGDKKGCVSMRKSIACHDGKISDPTDCGADAYCSTAGAEQARCVSRSCVTSAEQAPVPHDTCLPDGRLAACTANGALREPRSCAEGQSCVADGASGRCAEWNESLPEEPPPPATATEEEAEADPADGALDAIGEEIAENGPPPVILSERYDIEGVGCTLGSGGATPAAPPLTLALALLGISAWRSPRRRGRAARRRRQIPGPKGTVNATSAAPPRGRGKRQARTATTTQRCSG